MELIMDALLLRYFNPDFLDADLKAEASAADLSNFDARLLSVRLQLVLRRRDFEAAQSMLRRLEAMRLGVDRAFDVATARLVLAKLQNDKPAFMLALDAWLAGRAQNPNPDIWNHIVLEQPEIADWLAEVDPARLAPLPRRPVEISAEDRAFMKDLDIDAACLAAVTENREWLNREVLIFGSPEVLAKQYRLFAVHRRSDNGSDSEAMVVADGADLPSFILVLDGGGQFKGSFIAH
jgi:hypothetical protein